MLKRCLIISYHSLWVTNCKDSVFSQRFLYQSVVDCEYLFAERNQLGIIWTSSATTEKMMDSRVTPYPLATKSSQGAAAGVA